jgi:hypothetical protein
MESGCRYGSRAADAADVSRLTPGTPTRSLDPEMAPEVGYAVVNGLEAGEAVAELPRAFQKTARGLTRRGVDGPRDDRFGTEGEPGEGVHVPIRPPPKAEGAVGPSLPLPRSSGR